MIKLLQFVFGAVMVGLGVLMLVVAVRDGGSSAAQAIVAPLGLVGAGALAIASARRKPKRW